jgi:drug/metabolite transporter (DMT)-like permease
VIEGLLLALAGAVALGCVDLSAALVSRRLGTGLTILALMATSVVVLLPIALLNGGFPILDGPTVVTFVAFGAVCAMAYLTLIQALRLGPISVVGPITSSTGAATALMAVVFIGDRPGGLQLVGIAAAVVGSIFAGVIPGTSLRSLRLAGPGVVFAVLNVIFAAGFVLSLQALTAESWAGPIMVLRAVGGLWLLGVAAAIRWRPRVILQTSRARLLPWIVAACVLGALDTAGLVFLSLGFRLAPAWLVGIVGGLSPAIVTVGGIVLLRERIGRLQAVGLVLLAFSLVQLSLTA